MFILKLSNELILEISNYLKDWFEKEAFFKLDKRIWQLGQLKTFSEVYQISCENVNVLRLTTATSIRLPTQVISKKLLKLLLRFAYKAKALRIASTKTSEDFKKNILKYTIFEMANEDVLIHASMEEKSNWMKIVEKPFFARVKSPPKFRFYDNIDQQYEDWPERSTSVTNTEVRKHDGTTKNHGCIMGLPFVPSPVSMFNHKTMNYQLDLTEAKEITLLSPTYLHTNQSSDKAVINTASRYVEAVVFMDRFWIYVTSVDVYFHNANDVDSCADKTVFKFEEAAVAKINKKTTGFGSEYYEIVIVIGNLELVVVGGFFGENGKQTYRPFLGPTVQNLTVEMKQLVFMKSSSIFLLNKNESSSFTTGPRLLNKYLSEDAGRNWALHSRNFVIKGYYPVNPLRFGGHFSGVTNGSDALYKLVSLSLQCVARKAVFQADINQALNFAVKIKTLLPFVTYNITFYSITVHEKFSELDVYTRKLIRLMKRLEQSVGSRVILYNAEEREAALFIMKNKFNDEIKRQNKNVQKKFIANYVL